MREKKMSKLNVLLGLVLLCLAACQSVPGKVGNLTEQQVAALKEVGFVQDADDWVFSASDKLLFGTDSGWWSFNKPPVPEFSLIDELKLPKDVEDRICRLNMEQLFPAKPR